MLVHDTLRNTKLSTDYKVVDVDSKGLITGLTNEQEKELGKLNGFTFKENKKAEPKKTETKQEDKKEDKKEEPKQETKKPAPKKTTTRKTTTRKTTTKKEEK